MVRNSAVTFTCFLFFSSRSGLAQGCAPSSVEFRRQAHAALSLCLWSLSGADLLSLFRYAGHWRPLSRLSPRLDIVSSTDVEGKDIKKPPLRVVTPSAAALSGTGSFPLGGSHGHGLDFTTHPLKCLLQRSDEGDVTWHSVSYVAVGSGWGWRLSSEHFF